MNIRSHYLHESRGRDEAERLAARYDYVIVGAGTAGCALANRLSADASRSVLLLEAGPRDRSPLVRMPNGMIPMLKRGVYASFVETEPQDHLGGRTLFEIRSRVVGGSSSINGVQHARGSAKDYDQWAALGAAGWSYADVLPYFKRSESYSRGESAFHGGSGPFKVTKASLDDPIAKAWVDAALQAGFPYNDDLNGEAGVGFGAPDEARAMGRRTSSASAYLKPAMGRDNLTLATATVVRRLVMNGRRCEGVEFDLRGATRRVEAGEVVVCAGVFGSPHLLMLSGIGDPSALAEHGVASTLDVPGVGRSLKDHVGFQVSMTCPQPITDFRHTRPLGASAAIVNYLLFRRGFLAGSAIRAIGQICSPTAEPDWPDLKLQFVNVLMEGPQMQVARHGYLVRLSMTRPRSRGEVRLRSANPAAHPRISANYLADPFDVERSRWGVRVTRDILAQDAMAPFRGEEVAPGAAATSDTDIDAWLRATAGSDSHAVGTCRMGRDDEAVVDERLRVHGAEGLRVVDASVMPDQVGGNTVAPTLMIAEKGAEMILADR